MSVAARVATWLQKPGGWRSPVSGGFSASEGHPVVEIQLGELWFDITSYVRYEDQISITRGRSSEGSQIDPSRCSFTLDNRDGRFSPRNPLGAHYGLIGRNTPIRVSVYKNGIRRYRFHGEISSWPVQSDISGSEVVTIVEASGVTQRLSQGTSPLRSAIYREFVNPSRSSIIAYWPFEDAEGSASIASGLSDSPAMTYTGTPTFSTSTAWAGSAALPEMGTATFTGVVPGYTNTGEHSFRVLTYVPAAGPTSEGTLFKLQSSIGNVRSWEVLINTSGQLKPQAYDGAGTELTGSGYIAFDLRGQLSNVILEVVQDGADIDWTLTVQDFDGVYFITDSVNSTPVSGTVAGETQGAFSRAQIGGGTLGETVIGHVSLADDTNAYASMGRRIIGWRGEEPSARLTRILTTEEGIPFQARTMGTTGNEVTLGVQDQKSLIDLVQECESADLGIAFEPRDEIGIAYRTRLSLYNQEPSLTLDHDQNELSAALTPVDDDRYTRNDITVTRVSGSSYRATLESGNLSVQAPPNGVGRYDENVSISLGTDTQLSSQAGWRLHIGTTDEARYPSVSINLRHPTFTSSVEMMNSALALDIGDRIVITNPPSWLPPDDISQIVIGHTETIGGTEQHDITFVCAPESTWRTAVADSPASRADTSGSELTSGISSSATSISVSITDGSIWTTDAGEMPFDIRVGGEVMTVTAISGASSPQTFTVTRSVNGIVKEHLAGSDLRLANPVVVSL